MVDLKALRESMVDVIPDAVPLTLGLGQLRLILDAVQEITDAPVVWWCGYHHAESSGENGTCLIADLADKDGKGIWNGVNCESGRVALVQIGDEFK